MSFDKFITICATITLIALFGAMSACDSRDKEFRIKMAEKGFCRIPSYSDNYEPCPK